jgi:hypothetical protein
MSPNIVGRVSEDQGKYLVEEAGYRVVAVEFFREREIARFPTRGGCQFPFEGKPLGPPEGAEALLDMLYGPAATLLEPDLIAHKSYYQIRQYRGGGMESTYEDGIDSLQQTTSELLKGLSGPLLKTDELDKLADKYRLLFPVVTYLSELHTALVKQKHNYERSSKTRTGGRGVVEFHHEQLETATLELKLKVEELQYALESADKAVSMAQLKVDKAQEGRQRRIEAWLTAVALALALPDLLGSDTTAALLGLI